MTRFFSVLVLSILIAGCGLFGDDGPPSMNGRYRTVTQNQGVTATFSLRLSEESNDLSGSGQLTLEDQDSRDAQTFDLSASGEHDHPDVRLKMETGEGDVTRLDGTANDDVTRIKGTMTFPNGLQKEVVMREQ